MNKAFRVSVQYSAFIILTMVILNLVTSPGCPWAIFPIFGILWWPLSAYFAGSHRPYEFALCGTALLSALFILTWLFFTFGAHPWFIYPMLGIFWWPLSVWGTKVGARRFALTAAQYIIAITLAINMLTSPGFWWWVYPAIFILWWPLAVFLHNINREKGEQHD